MGVIVQSDHNSSRIEVELLCVVKGLLKKINRRFLLGDNMLVGSIDWIDHRGMIENVFQRTSAILDPPVANVDHILLLFSMDQPEPFTLTRFLVEAEYTEIPLTLTMNKLELVNEETMVIWKSRLRSWGYEPLFCSVESKYGLDSLAFILRDQTTVIVDPSGVGKSSMINSLRNNQCGSAIGEDNWFDTVSSPSFLVPFTHLFAYASDDLCSSLKILGSKWFEDQRVGEVLTRSGRGKHTTRNVPLLPLSGGSYLADTPEFNQPSLLKVTKQSLVEAFQEVRKMVAASEGAKCAFNDCLHVGEPGCIVRGDWEIYQYYFQLLGLGLPFLVYSSIHLKKKIKEVGISQLHPL
ncbi:hypothetical protein UlMin_000479 [Ulmus minor]